MPGNGFGRPRLKYRLGSVLAGLWMAVVACPALAAFDEVVVFGDSLSDIGNISAATFGIFPGADYFNGRFSDGPVWVETLAVDLGLDASTRWNAGGTNYAYGGATTEGGTSSLIIRNIGNQIGRYNASNTPTGNELFVLWGGGNDYFDGQADVAIPVNNLANHITGLAGAGAHTFLVPNLPPLGSVPDEFGNATLNARAAQHNALLATTLDGIETNLGVDIITFDVATTFDRILNDPAAFGFTNTTDTGIDAPGGTDTGGYLFWDGKHPTSFAHDLLADFAYQALFPGDFDDDGSVGQGDLALVLDHWGAAVADFESPGSAWVNANAVTGGLVGQDELALVLRDWGDTASLPAAVATIADMTDLSGAEIAGLIPEPGTVAMLGVLWIACRRVRG